ncbi:peptidase inhibitor family I36 protein [Streptomyces sp. NPDC026665]|uniref:peptidase inhibitor family I36 protein n=1 Tax=Streptomyces sp. NPDC026665 TaxID=3154798 RepID=UPI0033FD5576
MKIKRRNIAIAAAFATSVATVAIVSTSTNSHAGDPARKADKVAIQNAITGPEGYVVICAQPYFDGRDTCHNLAAMGATTQDVVKEFGDPFRTGILSIKNRSNRDFCFYDDVNFGGTPRTLAAGDTFADLTKENLGNPISSFQECPTQPSPDSSTQPSPDSSTQPSPDSSTQPSASPTESSSQSPTPTATGKECSPYSHYFQGICDTANTSLDRGDRLKKCPENSVCLWDQEDFRGAIYIYHLDPNHDPTWAFEPFKFPDHTFNESNVGLNGNVKSIYNSTPDRCVQLFVDVDPPKDRLTYNELVMPETQVWNLDPGYSEMHVSRKMTPQTMCDPAWMR